METTIKVTKGTKERITSLDLSEKGKTYDLMINELITYYTNHQVKYAKHYKNWEKYTEKWEKETQEWAKNIDKWKA